MSFVRPCVGIPTGSHEWCDKRDSCAHHAAIRNRTGGKPVDISTVSFMLCTTQAREHFVEQGADVAHVSTVAGDKAEAYP